MTWGRVRMRFGNASSSFESDRSPMSESSSNASEVTSTTPPNSTTGQWARMKRASEVPPVVLSSGETPNVASTAAAIYFAFRAADVVGWAMVIVVPILAVFLVRRGLARLRTSHIVPKSEITEEAGYHHVADRIGIGPGSIGTMVTPARPSGRARFPGGECDVQVRGGTLETSARVVVGEIDGAIVFVRPAGDEAASEGRAGGERT